MLKKIIAEDAHEKLAVADVKLENVIQDKLDKNCVADSFWRAYEVYQIPSLWLTSGEI